MNRLSPLSLKLLSCRQLLSRAPLAAAAFHTSAALPGQANKQREQIAYLRQRGIEILRKPDINKVKNNPRYLESKLSLFFTWIASRSDKRWRVCDLAIS